MYFMRFNFHLIEKRWMLNISGFRLPMVGFAGGNQHGLPCLIACKYICVLLTKHFIANLCHFLSNFGVAWPNVFEENWIALFILSNGFDSDINRSGSCKSKNNH